MKSLGAFLIVLLAAAPVARAAVPQTISYQGVLTDGAGAMVPDGPYDLTFSIYNVSIGGVALYTEVHAGVGVTRGGFSVVIGSTTPINLAFEVPYWLGIQVGLDPELAPRVGLTGAPYSLSLRLPFSQTIADAAPALYVKNTGAGAELVADGAVEIGSSTQSGDLKLFHSPSAAAVLEAYSSGFGAHLTELDESGNVVATFGADVNGTGAFLNVYRDVGFVGFYVDGNSGGSGEPVVGINGSARSCSFSMGLTGNGSVVLPTDAIGATEILDEPGVASNLDGASLVTLDGTIQTLMSRSIDAPAAGYVFVIGTCQAQATHTNGTASNADFGVSDAAGAFPANQDVNWSTAPAAPTGSYNCPLTVQGLFSVTAGAHTFYFLGHEISGSITLLDRQLSLMYFPTAHGTVTATTPQVSPAVPDELAPARGGLSGAEIETERAEARAFSAARLQREMEAMRRELDEVKRQLQSSAAAQEAAAQTARREP